MEKIIVILGPTSSGKSEVAIALAQKLNGEIISADSRQIYRGMDVGTGKITKSEQKMAKHYGIDIVSPKTEYNSAKFKKYANKIIKDILARGKLPIICGGTGFWIKALVDNVVYPEVAPDWKLREKLGKKSTEELFKTLQKLDPQRAKNIDAKNPVRLIRAIEICKSIGKVPDTRYKIQDTRYKFVQIGIRITKEKLDERIKLRLQKRFSAGMTKEVKKLHFKDKISWKKLESFGLGYSLIPKYLKGEIESKEELFEQVYLAEKNYAKRQMTWFKKDKRVIWLPEYKDIEKEVKKFLI
ncbi:MAG: tRNA dimethylallyltransferase [Candidatus Moranbacteria bacterium GW2011_GWF2_36_839]|nr:MAG: tRNA dimethylallyltransferase [Candidatus Moranbacteria bacterium GW2011_GWF1_36_78]KKQ17579.1 MAG: tRNA dimethylallyltransferase [Candidatus Moranbacteria bacterium GW2011_GWF2_36_839]HAT74304.1 tRNA (adenosine(37)-N6)-dimethylallyltransferase MiaA [Candidatus Moranbacteria bacterium]HBY10917.1 tRNA (adenosine(37)-N6)-dimethylallyltransferase MiaA [Candidatus Moranbacteria bacterium]